MIITKQKSFDSLLKILGQGPVFLIGCKECATLCHTGGEEEIQTMITSLKKNNIPISGSIILEPACNLLNNKRLLKPHVAELRNTKKILVLACGNGVQTLAEIFPDKDIAAGTDSLFLGEIKRTTEFEKRCTLCGDCLLDVFEGVCVVSRCPKSMLNGPCGGTRQGKCEINKDLDCVWVTIYNRLKAKDRLQQLQKIKSPKDWSKSLEMRRTC